MREEHVHRFEYDCRCGTPIFRRDGIAYNADYSRNGLGPPLPHRCDDNWAMWPVNRRRALERANRAPRITLGKLIVNFLTELFGGTRSWR